MSFLLQLDQWQTSIIFLVNETEEDLKEFIRKNPKKILLKEAQELAEALKDTSIDGQVNSFEKGGYYCMIKAPYKEICWAHEIFHVCNRILYDRGVTYDSSAEPWAYLIGYVTQVYLKEALPAVKEEQKERKLKKKDETEQIPDSHRRPCVQEGH